jgi:heptaprenyl diphosphate synthase
MANTLAWLTRGQISEVRTSFSLDRTEDDYFTAIEGKTATLMSSSCRMGAMTAHLPGDETEALAEFGRCFGMVYQLRDDILDLTATDNQLGKPAGQDLAEGIYNLPTLFALADTSVSDELRGLLGRPLDDGERERARKLVVATDGIDRTIQAAASYLDAAHAALELLPSENLRTSFGSLITAQLHDLPSY